MRNVIPKIYLHIIYTLFSFYSYSQNNTIDSLKRVLITEKEDTNKVNTLNYLSYTFAEISDYANTIKYENEAISLAKKINFKNGQINALNNIGWAYFSQGDDSGTFKSFLSALKISEESKDKSAIARINLNLSQIYSRKGNHVEELKRLLISLKLWEEIGNKLQIANNYGLIGGSYYNQENFADALKNYYEALKGFEDLGYKQEIGDMHQYIGEVYMAENNDSDALKNYETALKIRKEIGDKEEIAHTYNTMGQVYAAEGKYADALDMQNAGLKMFKELGTKAPDWSLPFSYSSIATIYYDEGDLANSKGNKSLARDKFKLAMDNLLLTWKLWEKIGRKDGVAQTDNFLGTVYIDLQNIPAAKNYIKKALEINKKLNLKSEFASSYYTLSTLDSIDGNYKHAFEHYKKYILYRDSVSNDETTKKNLQSKMQYESDKKEAIVKAEQDKKDAETKRVRNTQYLVIASLSILVLGVLIIAFIQLRNNKQKQKANKVLENTLSNLKSAQSQLIQSEKMASLGELTAGIAHEIQNPLNFVNNFSDVNTELIEEAGEEIDKGNINDAKVILNDIKENEQKINHHGKRADAIVKGMLQHSRSSTGVKEPTDIKALSDEYLRLSYHGLRAKEKEFNATMKTDFDNSVGKINIIPQDIGRVLLNLYNNAFYAISEKKNQIGEGYEPTVTVSTKKIDDKVVLTVMDNGNGIPQKILDKIFQPFFTTKPTGQGTGLGLSLSYDIIKAHGGEIEVETKEGEGSEFIIELPIK